MRRRGRDKPGELLRPSHKARALLTGILVALLGGLEVSAVPCQAAQSDARPAEAPLIYRKQRNFKIPFNLSAAQKSRIKEVILLVSQDRGEHWKAVSRTDSDHPAFSFRAARDGEYWFTVQTRTNDGKVSPTLDTDVEPKLKVVIDTVAPTLSLEPDRRRASTAGVRWSVKDEHLDLRSMVLEYQVEGVGVWSRVPIPRPKAVSSRVWDAGTGEPLRVRMSVADLAGNVTDAILNLPNGSGEPPEPAASVNEDIGPPSMDQITNSIPEQPRMSAGQGFTPIDEPPPTSPQPAASDAPARPRTAAGDRNRARSKASDWDRDPGPPAGPPGLSTVAASASAGATELFPNPDRGAPKEAGQGVMPAGAVEGSRTPTNGGPASRRGQPSAPPASAGTGAGSNTLLVDSPRFKLQYAVDDAGPSGPATVELWITQDGGRTWIRRGDDPDRVSPIDVDLGGEGTFGICVVARSSAGLGDQPPAPGDPPQSWVEVDSTPPGVQLDPVQVGTGLNSGKVAITWRASDLHMAPRSVSLYWRPDQAGAAWQPLADAQENTGRFIWVVPPNVPSRFHIRVEAVDSVGHRGYAETTDTGAVMVDRSRPRSRIIGLDTNSRGGGGSSWPMR